MGKKTREMQEVQAGPKEVAEAGVLIIIRGIALVSLPIRAIPPLASLVAAVERAAVTIMALVLVLKVVG